MEHVTDPINRNIETTVKSQAQMTTQPPSEKRLQEWNEKWIRLSLTNPKLHELLSIAWIFSHGCVNEPKRGKLLLLFGGSGNGKTHVAKAIINYVNNYKIGRPWATPSGRVVHADADFVNWPRMVDKMVNGGWERFESLVKTHCIAVDDIGAEHDPKGFSVEKLYRILNEREDRYTIITTNVGADEWHTRFEKRIASRFLRNSIVVDMTEVPDFNL